MEITSFIHLFIHFQALILLCANVGEDIQNALQFDQALTFLNASLVCFYPDIGFLLIHIRDEVLYWKCWVTQKNIGMTRLRWRHGALLNLKSIVLSGSNLSQDLITQLINIISSPNCNSNIDKRLNEVNLYSFI